MTKRKAKPVRKKRAAFMSHFVENLERMRLELMVAQSRKDAVSRYGTKKVEAAEGRLKSALKSNPKAFQLLREDRDPYDLLVRLYLAGLI